MRVFFSLVLFQFSSALRADQDVVSSSDTTSSQVDGGNMYLHVLEQFRRKANIPNFIFDNVFPFLNFPMVSYDQVQVGQWIRLEQQDIDAGRMNFISCQVRDKWNDQIVLQCYDMPKGRLNTIKFSKQEWDRVSTLFCRKGRVLDLSASCSKRNLRILFDEQDIDYSYKRLDPISASILEHTNMDFGTRVAKEVSMFVLIQLFGLSLARKVAIQRFGADGCRTPWSHSHTWWSSEVDEENAARKFYTLAVHRGWVGVLQTCPKGEETGLPQIQFHQLEQNLRGAAEANREDIVEQILHHGRLLTEVNIHVPYFGLQRQQIWYGTMADVLWIAGARARFGLVRMILNYGTPFVDAAFYWKLFGMDTNEFGDIPTDDEMWQWIKGLPSADDFEDIPKSIKAARKLKSKYDKYQNDPASFFSAANRHGLFGLAKMILRLPDVSAIDLVNKVHRKSWSDDASTPLMYACRIGHWPLVKLNLDLGAAVNSVGEDMTPPLSCAISGNNGFNRPYWSGHDFLNIIRELVNHGAKVDEVDPKTDQSTLQAAVCDIRPGHFIHIVVRILLEGWVEQKRLGNLKMNHETVRDFVNTNPNMLMRRGNPLYMAIHSGNVKLVDLLLKYGADVRRAQYQYLGANKHKWVTALQCACDPDLGCLGVVSSILNHYKMHYEDNDTYSAILEALIMKPKKHIATFLRLEHDRIADELCKHV